MRVVEMGVSEFPRQVVAIEGHGMVDRRDVALVQTPQVTAGELPRPTCVVHEPKLGPRYVYRVAAQLRPLRRPVTALVKCR